MLKRLFFIWSLAIVGLWLVRFNGSLTCVSTSTGTVALNLIYTDINSVVKTLSETCSAITTSTVADTVHAIRALAGSNVQYSTTVGGAQVTYDVDVSLETIQ